VLSWAVAEPNSHNIVMSKFDELDQMLTVAIDEFAIWDDGQRADVFERAEKHKSLMDRVQKVLSNTSQVPEKKVHLLAAPAKLECEHIELPSGGTKKGAA